MFNVSETIPLIESISGNRIDEGCLENLMFSEQCVGFISFPKYGKILRANGSWLTLVGKKLAMFEFGRY